MLLEQEMLCLQAAKSRRTPAPVSLDTPQQRRAFYMRLIFRSDFLLRRIVSFL